MRTRRISAPAPLARRSRLVPILAALLTAGACGPGLADNGPRPALAATGAAAEPALEAGLRAVSALAELNGQALACQDAAAIRRAKALMLAHAPKTDRFGSLYEERTQLAFLAITRGERACADAGSLTNRLQAVADQLQQALPAGAATR